MPTTIREVDIAIAGAGPAGLLAAATAAEAGAAVELLDAAEWAGGRLALQTQPLQGPATIYGGLSGVGFCGRLADDAVSAGATLRLGVEVKDVRALDPPASGFELALSGHGEDARLCARAVVLAIGSLESWLDVPGLPLRGAALSGDVQAGLNRAGVRPGRRVVMVGSDNAGLLIAANLLDAGVEVVAVVDESPSVVGREVNAAPLRDAGVELLTSTRLVEVHGARTCGGRDSGRWPARGARCEADCLCMAGPRRPNTRLAASLGLPMLQLPVMGGETPAHDARLAAAIAGVYICGDAAGVENGAVSLESGRLAGLAATAYLGIPHPDSERLTRLARGRLAYLRRGRRGLVRREAKAALARAARG